MKSPTFFIVGAAKAGTTSLNDYLAQYSDIFVPAVKEMHFFGNDLQQKQRKNSSLNRDQYLSFFADMSDEKVAGEASVLYLKSETAACEIREFCPEAKIIVMLREPVQMLHALHAQLISQGDENILDFEEALNAEAERKQGKRLPRGVTVPDDGLFYREMAQLGTQLKRYFDVFPREQIHIIFFEDFVQDARCEVEKVRDFLGLAHQKLQIDMSIKNPRSRPFSQHLTRFLYHPPKWSIRFAKFFFARDNLVKIQSILRKLNDRKAQKAPMPAYLHSKLSFEFADEVRKLEELTGRDLMLWRIGTSFDKQRVSVVIPCFNCVETISRAINSVLSQSRKVDQIILVDDASTDGSLAILEEFAREYEAIELVKISENQGVSNARNIGWDHVAGDWLAFLDSDDAWHPEKIKRQMQVVALNPQLSIIGHGCEVGEVDQDWGNLPDFDNNGFSKFVRKINKWQLMISNPWPTPSVMVRSNIPIRFDRDLNQAEDYLLWLRIVIGGGIGLRIDLNLARLFKDKHGAGGLSEDLFANSAGELEAIRRLRNEGNISSVIAFVWMQFSRLKHYRRLLSKP